MPDQPYYLAYETRYQKAYAAGADFWGHTPEDEELTEYLSKWVKQNNLEGKKIIEFFCGEGASGVILSKMGCDYHGVDISPTAAEKARNMIKEYPGAKITELNVVSDQIDETYDAALDVMGIHMLVTDTDRVGYLKNAFSCLIKGAPILFFRELYAERANDQFMNSYDEWLSASKNDYTTPKLMNFIKDGKEIEIQLPSVPGRSKTRDGYKCELSEAGFIVDSIIEMEPSRKTPNSVSIYAHKP